jgi:uncharacterized protein
MDVPQKPPKAIPCGIHILAKLIGPACNLNCDYCFYLEKSALFPQNENFRMPDEVLQAITFPWLKKLAEEQARPPKAQPEVNEMNFVIAVYHV